MKYIVYQTLNLVNNKIYVGIHRTENPLIFDGYLGCGVSLQKHWFKDNPRTPFQQALKKYGFTNFRRTTLKEFDTLQEALDFEAQIVNLEFTKRPDTYNIAIGGGYAKIYFPIYQFDRTGKLIREWDNQSLAAEALGVTSVSINRAINQKGSCCGYLWSKNSSINIKDFSWHVGNTVYQYDMSGRLVSNYESTTEASKITGYLLSAICRAIHCQLPYQGFYWSNTLYEKFTPKTLSLKGKILYIYDLEGNYLTTLKSPKEAAIYYGCRINYSPTSNIREAMMLGKPFKNTQISLEKLDSMPKIIYNRTNEAKRVGRFDDNGILLEEFDSIKQAARKYGSKIFRAVRNKQSKVSGFIFKFLN